MEQFGVVGVGVDLEKIQRIVKACEREHFVQRIFSEKECSQFDKSKRRAASDFAAKEAVVKVFGTGFSGVEPKEIEILRDESGAPYVQLAGRAKEIAAKKGIKRIEISISNTKELVTAFAVGLGQNT